MKLRNFIRFTYPLLLAGLSFNPLNAETGHGVKEPKKVDFSFNGPFGQFDTVQLQRGFQIYKEVCSACHSMNYVHFRDLESESGPHFTKEEVAAIAAEYTITDGPNDEGGYFERPRVSTDKFPNPYKNENEARGSNGGAYPPDLSLIAKGRVGFHGTFKQITHGIGGPEYIYSLLTGYEEHKPDDLQTPPGLYYNPYFSTLFLGMPKPLSDGQVNYYQNTDDNPNNNIPETVDQYAKDVTAFLMWTAEPKLNERKSLGFNFILFMVILTALLTLSYRQVWRELH